MSRRRDPSPPWLPEALLWLSSRRADWRDTVIGDLREEFAIRRRRGYLAAALWYWAEAADLVLGGIHRLGVREATTHDRTWKERGMSMVRALGSDIRQAVRQMRRQPGFTAVVVVTLAVGIASTAVIFNVLDALVLRVLQLPTADRLVVLGETTPSAGAEDRAVAPANFLDWRSRATSFDYMGAYDQGEANLATRVDGTTPERVSVAAMSAGLLDVLGATPQGGRLIAAGDEPYGSPRVVVLSDGLWRRRFGADPGVIGKVVLLDDVPHAVVGIASPQGAFPYGAAAWTALSLSPQDAQERQREYLSVVARLRDGTTLAAARDELAAICTRLQQEYPASNASVTSTIVPIHAAVRDEGTPAMVGAWQTGAVFVLLIACVNVAQLLLARGTARQQEFAVRIALGAGLGRVTRQLVTEGLVISGLAAAVSLAVSWVALAAITASMPAELVRVVAGWDMVGINGRLIVFTFLVSLVAGAFFSVLPALQAAYADMNDVMKRGARAAGSQGVGRTHAVLVVAEIAGALTLTTATVLSLQGASRLLYGHPGYDHAQVLTASVSLPQTTYPTSESRRQFYDRALAGIAATPGVMSAAIVSAPPAGMYNTSRPLIVEGAVGRDPSDLPRADYRVVSPGYFDALRIPVLRGRSLDASDRPDGPAVAVVSQSLATRFWPGVDPVGRRFRTSVDAPWITVVGVAGDVVHHWFNRRNYPTIYRPHAQDPRTVTSLVVKTTGEPLAMAASVQAALAQVDGHLPLYNVQSLEHLREVNLTGLTYLVTIMMVIAGLSIVLACLGTYAVMAYGISRQRREMGLRMALGADAGAIVRLIGRRVVTLTALGIACGAVGAVAAGKVLAAILFGIVSLDLVTCAAVALALAVGACAAGFLPLRSALSVDPALALRAE